MVVADGIEVDTDVLRSGGGDALGVADDAGVPAYALLSTAVNTAVTAVGESVEGAGMDLRAVAQELDETDAESATGAHSLTGW
ncbi:hypothetical protein [Actinomyces sp.]|uniref:hypothetical protein n=1 Tax=Actinomyces sp. TaxID=29317 RepID=UPI0026DD82FF|nr:hypothetical protein [Actinomyces sp.]MDO4901383.1 hypothetical protein [Actinomyces sp.]